jgi:hypothetical protein
MLRSGQAIADADVYALNSEMSERSFEFGSAEALATMAAALRLGG